MCDIVVDKRLHGVFEVKDMQDGRKDRFKIISRHSLELILNLSLTLQACMTRTMVSINILLVNLWASLKRQDKITTFHLEYKACIKLQL